MNKDMGDNHILVFSFPGLGAINPSLQLAKRLIKMGAKVTFLTTLSAHNQFIKATTTLAQQGINIVPFSDGYDDGFKSGESREQFLSELEARGSRAISELIKSSAEKGEPIGCFVYTMFQTWAAKLAHSLHIPSALLWIQPAIVFDIYYYYFNGFGDSIVKTIIEPSSFIELPGLPSLGSLDFPSYLAPSNSCTVELQVVKEQLEWLDSEVKPKILVNTFEALEEKALRAIEKFNLVGIGPLVSSAFLDEKDDQSSRGTYVQWLDSKSEASVVYVSFGSIAELSMQQMEEIGRGLLESQRPFMWVIKARENGEKQEDKLSCREELEERGIIVPWCYQVEVLSHPSLGCFVSHCGWNSSLESLVFGIPVVGFPQWTDQATNAKLVEDVWKTGVRVAANQEGIVEGDELKKCIDMAMGMGERGEEMRRNAKKWKDLAREAMKEGGSSDLNLKALFGSRI